MKGRTAEDADPKSYPYAYEFPICLNPFLLRNSLPPFDISTRPRRLERVASRFISYEELFQILVLSFAIHSNHSGILGIFSDSG